MSTPASLPVPAEPPVYKHLEQFIQQQQQPQAGTGEIDRGRRDTLSEMPTESTIERRVRLAAELVRLREAAGLSQTDAGKLADPVISQRMWSKMESGAASIEAMSAAFEVLGYQMTVALVRRD